MRECLILQPERAGACVSVCAGMREEDGLISAGLRNSFSTQLPRKAQLIILKFWFVYRLNKGECESSLCIYLSPPPLGVYVYMLWARLTFLAPGSSPHLIPINSSTSCLNTPALLPFVARLFCLLCGTVAKLGSSAFTY